MFREDAKRFYRELGKKTISDMRRKKFILEQEISHHEDAQWMKDQQEELKDINQMEWKDFTVEELRVNITRQPTGSLDQTNSPTSGSSSSLASRQKNITNNAGSITDSRMASRGNHQLTP